MNVILSYLVVVIVILVHFDLISYTPTHAFNIDEEYPIIISNKFNGKEAHFGASVVLLPVSRSGSRNEENNEDTSSADITKGWVIIGAPKANSTNPIANQSKIFEPGLIWRCALGSFSGKIDKRICEIVEIDPTGEYDPRDPGLPFRDRKDGGWLGGSMFVGESDRFVTCASRWVSQKFTAFYLLNGMCYWLPKNNMMVEHEPDDSSWPWLPQKLSYRLSPLLKKSRQHYEALSPTLNKTLIYDWSYGQFGFSIHLTPENELIAGAPGIFDWTGSIVYYKDQFGPRRQFSRYNAHVASPAFSEVLVVPAQSIEQISPSDYFGYSVTSGKFFTSVVSKNQTQFASGAPRSSNLSGKVLIFTLEEVTGNESRSEGRVKLLIEPIEGKDTNKGTHYGSYFGHSLLALDVNADGFDELIVSAPLYGTTVRYKRNAFVPLDTQESETTGNSTGEEEDSPKKMKSGDEGCVFVYFSNGEEFVLPPQALCGDKISGARFGSSLSSLHDINDDGFKDMAVGAPYENEGRGAVYIYHGGQDYVQLGQKLEPESIDPRIRTFGWSLSFGVDIDENGYSDLAVGAYETNQVVVFRTIPIVHLTSSLTASIPKLMSTTEEFNVTTCINYSGRGQMPSVLGIRVKLTVEVEGDGKRLMAFVNEMPEGNRQLTLSIERLLNFRNTNNGLPTKCPNFPAVRVGSLEGLTRQLFIRLDYWLDGYDRSSNATPKPIHYEILTQGISTTSGYPYPGVNLNKSKSDFNDFYHTKIPMPAGNQFGTERLILPVGTICESDGDPECQANLTVVARLRDYQSEKIYDSVHPFVLGSTDILALEVELANYREVATPPVTVALTWSQPPIVRRLPANCENKKAGNKSNQLHLLCTIRGSIKENEKVVVTIELDMSGVYGNPPEKNKMLDIYLEGNTNSSLVQPANHTLSVSLQTQLKPQNFSILSSKMEYSMGNTSIPTFGLTQAFEVGLEGFSTAAGVEVNFDIPVGIVLKGSREEYRLIGVKRPIVTFDGDMVCSPVNGTFFDVGVPPVILKMIGVGGDDPTPEKNDDDDQQYELESDGVSYMKVKEAGKILKKRVKRSILEGVGKSVWVTPGQEYFGGTLKIHCGGGGSDDDDSSKSGVETICLRVRCTAAHFTPSKKAVVEFKLRMLNEVASKLLNMENHHDHVTNHIDSITSLWIESVGQVRTLDEEGNPFGESGVVRFTSRLEIAPPYDLPAWIIIVSVCGGLLLFSLVTILLKRCGFFKRSKRDELMKAKYKVFQRYRASAKGPGSASTLRMRTSSSTRRASKQGHSTSQQNTINNGGGGGGIFIPTQVSSSGGGGGGGGERNSTLAMSVLSSPGTIVKQREMPGAMDLSELRRLNALSDDCEYY